MKRMIYGSALALFALAAAQPALANEQDDGAIVVVTTLLHPSVGLMNDHMHDGGDVMVGLRFERRRYDGANVSGTDTLSDSQVLAAGYGARAKSMEMDMVMLDLMYAPTEDLTFMVMPHYMWHRMEMVGIDPMAGMTMDGHGGHMALGFGETHDHSTEGFGDTLVSASYRLANRRGLKAHATMGLWAPTGAVDRKNPDGTYVHYGMQPGSGTWNIEPSITLSGTMDGFGWGAQGSYRWRTEDSNDSGFSFGDKAQLSSWISYLVDPSLGATARLEWVHEGPVEGHHNGPHGHVSPPDLQQNYGGDTVSLGLGFNWLLPVGARQGPQLGAELAVPVYQNLNGVQLPQDWRFSLGLSQTF